MKFEYLVLKLLHTILRNLLLRTGSFQKEENLLREVERYITEEIPAKDKETKLDI